LRCSKSARRCGAKHVSKSKWPLRGASSALPAALREKRKRRRETVTEGKRQTQRERERERERERVREREREKMRRCEDVKMRR